MPVDINTKLLDQTLALSGTSFFATNVIPTEGYDYIRVLYIVLSLTGTSPNFKADLQERIYNADGTTTDVDYFNDGNHAANFAQNYGPGYSTTQILPPFISFNLHCGASDNAASVRVLVYGYTVTR